MQGSEFKDIDESEPELNSFFLIDLNSEKERFSDIDFEEIQINNTKINSNESRGEKTKLVITSNKDVAKCIIEGPSSAIVILVAKDGNTSRKFSKTFIDRKNVYVCLHEEIKQIISTHLERRAFTGIREVCEFLQAAISAPDSLKATAHPKISRTSEKTAVDTSPLELASHYLVATKARHKSTRKRKLEVETSPLGSDHKRNKTSCLLDVCKENKEIKARVERLIDEIVGMFNRSTLPIDEHPNLRNTMQQCVNEELLRDLQTLSKSIRSCRYRFSTLQVCVDADIVSERLKNDIAKKLEAHNITDYSIISSSIRKFAKVPVGSRISLKTTKGDCVTGTLGGFARTSDEKSDGLCVLVSRHLAELSRDGKIYIEDGKEHLLATVMNLNYDKRANETYLDMTAASVENASEEAFDTRYQTEDKKLVPGKLCQYDNAKLKGLSVHICGASTKLGLGTITIPEQHSVQPGGVEENYIVVEDRETEDYGKFCTEGDSGAIVCAESPDNYGKEVQLISMVAGEELVKKGSYKTVRLDKGLSELSTLAKKKFEIC